RPSGCRRGSEGTRRRPNCSGVIDPPPCRPRSNVRHPIRAGVVGEGSSTPLRRSPRRPGYCRPMRRIVASWIGSGLILGRLRGSHSGSGTVGAALALAMSLMVGRWGWPAQLAGTVLVSGLSVWSSEPFSHVEGDSDPGWVVADEAAGTFLATIG